MSHKGGNVQNEIILEEHQHNLSAKRVINVDENGNAINGALAAGVDFDYIGITNDNATQDTLVFKDGGSGGTTIRTLVIVYASGASKISDDLSSLAYS